MKTSAIYTIGTGARPAPYARMHTQTAVTGSQAAPSLPTRKQVARVAMQMPTTRELQTRGICRRCFRKIMST